MTLDRAIGASNEIDKVSKFDNSLSFGAKQNALRQIPGGHKKGSSLSR